MPKARRTKLRCYIQLALVPWYLSAWKLGTYYKKTIISTRRKFLQSFHKVGFCARCRLWANVLQNARRRRKCIRNSWKSPFISCIKCQGGGGRFHNSATASKLIRVNVHITVKCWISTLGDLRIKSNRMKDHQHKILILEILEKTHKNADLAKIKIILYKWKNSKSGFGLSLGHL